MALANLEKKNLKQILFFELDSSEVLYQMPLIFDCFGNLLKCSFKIFIVWKFQNELYEFLTKYADNIILALHFIKYFLLPKVKHHFKLRKVLLVTKLLQFGILRYYQIQ